MPPRALIYVEPTIYDAGASLSDRPGGRPQTTALTAKPLRQQRIQFTRARMGGDISAIIEGDIPLTAVDAWLNHLGAQVQIVDAGSAVQWVGTIETITIEHNDITTSITRNGMINQLYVRYVVGGVTVVSALGENAASVGQWGRWQGILDVGETTQSAAESQRDQYLDQRGWPARSDTTRLTTQRGTAQSARITLECYGLYHHLDRIVYNLAPSTTTSGYVFMANLLAMWRDNDAATYGYDGIGWGTGTPFVDYFGISGTYPTAPAGLMGSPVTVPATNGYESVRSVLDRYLAHGTSDGPYAFMLHAYEVNATPGQYVQWKTWAAATPTTIHYEIRPPHTITTPAGAHVPLITIRPDRMARIISYAARPGVTAAQSAAAFYLDQTEYEWVRGQGEQVTLTPFAKDGVTDALRLFQ